MVKKGCFERLNIENGCWQASHLSPFHVQGAETSVPCRVHDMDNLALSTHEYVIGMLRKMAADIYSPYPFEVQQPRFTK